MTTKFTPDQAEHIGTRLRATRKRRGLTLAVASESIGVDYSQLSRMERGDFRIFSKNLQKICKFLEVSVAVKPRAVHSLDFAERATRIAAQSPVSQRVLEAVLNALDHNN